VGAVRGALDSALTGPDKGQDVDFKPPQMVSMKGHLTLTEKWLQQRIAEDTTLLGLGDLVVKDVERRQPHAGRLDLLLTDLDGGTRYEVEIQLGLTDESHIIRTIEYWDIERRRYPQYEHVAVIAAEDITSRFLNVISLFNGFIPLIAIQIRALQVEGVLTLVSTKVIDVATLATDEEDDSGGATDRSFWEMTRASKETLGLTDRMLEIVRAKIDPNLTLKYNTVLHWPGEGRAPQQLRSVPPSATAPHRGVQDSTLR
jgi:hypothetical protein